MFRGGRVAAGAVRVGSRAEILSSWNRDATKAGWALNREPSLWLVDRYFLAAENAEEYNVVLSCHLRAYVVWTS
jgi:hypothetical protein